MDHNTINYRQKKMFFAYFFYLKKAFDMVPCKMLMSKLERLHLHPLLLTWIHWFCVGAIAFSYYLSLELSRGAKLTLYGDDMLLYKTIASDRDYIELQDDIDKIS